MTMSLPPTKQDHEKSPRQALCTFTTRKRYQHPLLMFIVVLIVLLGFRRIYDPLRGHEHSVMRRY
jgi:hypothetical protein